MQITRMVVGMFATNTYLLQEGDEVILIDPACKADKLFPLLEGKKPLAILLTHGHFDHLKACDEIAKKYHCPIYINKADEKLIRDKNQSAIFGINPAPTISTEVSYLQEGEMTIGSFRFEVIFTPGHSKGSTCFLFTNDLFTGDTLFRNSVGRTDLVGGSESELKASLRILKELDPCLVIHPGHDEETTLELELNNNPYL